MKDNNKKTKSPMRAFLLFLGILCMAVLIVGTVFFIKSTESGNGSEKNTENAVDTKAEKTDAASENSEGLSEENTQMEITTEDNTTTEEVISTDEHIATNENTNTENELVKGSETADSHETENTADDIHENTTEDISENTTENTLSRDGKFSDAVFLGDSRTEGLIWLTGINTNVYAHKGLNVTSVYTERIIPWNGTYVTPMQALQNTEYNKVYLMFGVNETGWPDSNIFIEDYRKIIHDIKADNPEVKIYIQSVIPVSRAVSDRSSYVKNDKIAEYNLLLEDLAKDEGIEYVNVAEAVSDNGVLPDAAAVDGIHLTQEYCYKWLNYLREHT